MPKQNYAGMPYEKQWSTGEHVISHKFYDPDPEYSEDEETYCGYNAYDLFGLRTKDTVPAVNSSNLETGNRNQAQKEPLSLNHGKNHGKEDFTDGTV